MVSTHSPDSTVTLPFPLDPESSYYQGVLMARRESTIAFVELYRDLPCRVYSVSLDKCCSWRAFLCAEEIDLSAF